MSASLHDCQQLRICEEIARICDASPMAAKANPYRAGTAERRHVAPTEGKGYQDFVRVTEGLDLLVRNRLHRENESVNYVGEGVLKMHFRLSGSSRIYVENGQHLELNGAYCGVLLHPEGVNKLETSVGGIAERWAVIYCQRAFLGDALGVDVDDMPAQLRRFISNEPYEGYGRTLPLTPIMSHGLSGLLDSDLTSALRNIQVEGRCLELVSQVLGLLKNSADEDGPRVSRRDAECIQHAREILQREFAAPPTLRVLARRIGINQNKLNQGFRALFGLTVGDFIIECRMRHAYDLLREGGQSVALVAYAVGYEFPGNFTTAFKRFFGVPPRTMRR